MNNNLTIALAKPFVVIGETIQGLATIVLKHFAVEPNCRPVYEPCRIPAPPSEFDVYGRDSVVETHLRWALQKASCWQDAREFYYFMGKVDAYYSEDESSLKPQLRLRKRRKER